MGVYMSRHVVVVDYNPIWKKKYEQEALLIKEIFADNLIAIYHIGSTSVDGLAAKPIIDIMVVVRSLAKVDNIAKSLLKIGYEYLGEFGIAGRRYLCKGKDEQTHHIHIFQADDWDNISRHLAFSNYLRTHAQERAEYAQIKTELAHRFSDNIDSYFKGKESFVRNIETRALFQFDGTWDKMYLAARNVQFDRKISSLVEAGGVSAAILTLKGTIYTGVCIDTACSLGMCAERNAIANMITSGESAIRRVMAIGRNGKVILPCGACRELMTQLMPDNYLGIEIMLDYEEKQVVTLGDITPNWWL